MREKKFRVWDDISKTMTYPGEDKYCITMVGSVCLDETDNGGILENRSYRLTALDYTGLKGKNAYEGDIIRDNIGIGVIEYVDKYAAFRVNYVNDRYKWFYDYLESEFETLEVIGNIYESPDLLNTNV